MPFLWYFHVQKWESTTNKQDRRLNNNQESSQWQSKDHKGCLISRAHVIEMGVIGAWSNPVPIYTEIFILRVDHGSNAFQALLWLNMQVSSLNGRNLIPVQREWHVCAFGKHCVLFLFLSNFDQMSIGTEDIHTHHFWSLVKKSQEIIMVTHCHATRSPQPTNNWTVSQNRRFLTNRRFFKTNRLFRQSHDEYAPIL